MYFPYLGMESLKKKCETILENSCSLSVLREQKNLEGGSADRAGEWMVLKGEPRAVR